MKVFLSEPYMGYFLFPDAKPISSFGYLISDQKVIYFTKRNENTNKVHEKMSLLYKDFVVVTQNASHAVDMMVDTREDYINTVVSMRGLRPSNDLTKKTSMLSDRDFMTFIKLSLHLRRWCKEMFGVHEKVYNLYAALIKSKKEFLRLYVDLRKTFSAEEIYSSVLTFLLRISSYEEQKDMLSEYYRKVISNARNQNVRAKQAVAQVAALSKEIPKENRMIGFYLSLKG